VRCENARKVPPAGFTLIELLVVISIIIILAALLFPAFARAKEQARTTKCLNNVRQITLGLNLYLDDFGSYPLSFSLAPDGIYGQTWQDNLAPYLNERNRLSIFRFLLCPSFKPVEKIEENGWTVQVPHTIYAYSSGTKWSLTHTPNESLNPIFVKESDVVRPSEMIALGDAYLWSFDRFKVVLGSTDFQFIPIKQREKMPGYEREQKAVRKRHNTQHNIGFCDGHVESLSYKKLFTDSSQARRLWNYDNQPHILPFEGSQ
jgi:prepilin-type processing-associated H-X9-DG protein/prepilin-type N-terminal cleavage/methylation domain-containing protein